MRPLAARVDTVGSLLSTRDVIETPTPGAASATSASRTTPPAFFFARATDTKSTLSESGLSGPRPGAAR